MKKLILVVLMTAVCLLPGCDMLEKTCRAEGCEETNLYDEGYCKKHYYINVGDNLLKEVFN